MIRPIKRKDLKELIKLEEDLFNESFGKEFVFSSIVKKNTARYLIYSKFNKIIGYIGYISVKPEVEIFGFGIAKKYQNSGYGTKLLKWFIKKHHKLEFKKIYLDVRTKNNSAIHLYEKLGFERIKRRPNFYGNDDSFTYVKEI